MCHSACNFDPLSRGIGVRAGQPVHQRRLCQDVERAGVETKLPFKAHPHMLRHACGFALANKGHDTRSLQAYLGHKNIQHTVRYTDMAPGRFKNFWRE
jgi:site-specific recombinase XerD